MNVLVINSGSSSVKYKVFDMKDVSMLASGHMERIGEPGTRFRYRWQKERRRFEERVDAQPVSDHAQGLEKILAVMSESDLIKNPEELSAIGHRVVHGGEVFREPVVIDNGVVEKIREMIPLAPLHNPANLIGIEAARQICGGVPQVAVFDTAFHQSLPFHAFHYAIPRELYTAHRIRRYGFHGTSHAYVAGEAAAYLGRSAESLNLITLHLGNGASVTAIQGGRSIETSMGMTPLEGLIMGSRCGDLDPAIVFYLKRTLKQSDEDIERILYSESGLRGICGTNDMREIERRAGKGDRLAQLAIDMYCYRIRKYIGAYTAVLGIVHAVVFTGGIGENSPLIRRGSCEGLDGFGIMIDDEKNRAPRAGPCEIHKKSGEVKVLVIPTNEELEIARQTVKLI